MPAVRMLLAMMKRATFPFFGDDDGSGNSVLHHDDVRTVVTVNCEAVCFENLHQPPPVKRRQLGHGLQVKSGY